MWRVGLPLAVALCGGALAGCGGQPKPTPAPTPAPWPFIEPAWDDFEEGFEAGSNSKKETEERASALSRIMSHYDDNSTVSMWDAAKTDADNCEDGVTEDCTLAVENKGREAIREFFDGYFDRLQGCSRHRLTTVIENTTSAPGSVFVAWRCLEDRYSSASESFVFDGDFVPIIRKQNIVVHFKLPDVSSQIARQAVGLSQQLSTQGYKPETVQAVWDNHFAAFTMGANGKADEDKTRALDRIMLDYTDHSLVMRAGFTLGFGFDLDHKKGRSKIREMFEDLFKGISDDCDLEAPLAEVTGDSNSPNSTAKQVFLVWRTPASGIHYSTETLIFDDNLKIITQNIVEVTGVKKPCPTSAPTSAPLTV